MYNVYTQGAVDFSTTDVIWMYRVFNHLHLQASNMFIHKKTFR